MIRRQSKDKDSTVHRAEYQSTILTLGDFYLKYKTFITHMNTSGLLQSKWSPKGFTLVLQVTRSIHDSMNLPKFEFTAYIYILYYQLSINFQFSPNLAGFPDILN